MTHNGCSSGVCCCSMWTARFRVSGPLVSFQQGNQSLFAICNLFYGHSLAILMCECEVWPALGRHLQRVEVFQMNRLKLLCAYTWEDRQTNVSMREQCQRPSVSGEVWYRRLSGDM